MAYPSKCLLTILIPLINSARLEGMLILCNKMLINRIDPSVVNGQDTKIVGQEKLLPGLAHRIPIPWLELCRYCLKCGTYPKESGQEKEKQPKAHSRIHLEKVCN